MPRRLISVDDAFNLPDSVNVQDANLPTGIVRFVDENGDPLPTRTVVIKVSASTGEILDIVSEV